MTVYLGCAPAAPGVCVCMYVCVCMCVHFASNASLEGAAAVLPWT